MSEVVFFLSLIVVPPVASCASWAPAIIPHILSHRRQKRMPLFAALYYQMSAFVVCIGLTLGGIGGIAIALCPPLSIIMLGFLPEFIDPFGWIGTIVLLCFAIGCLICALAFALLRKFGASAHWRWSLFPMLLCGWVSAILLTDAVVQREIRAQAEEIGASVIHTQSFRRSLVTMSHAYSPSHVTAKRGREYLKWSYAQRGFYVAFVRQKTLQTD